MGAPYLQGSPKVVVVQLDIVFQTARAGGHDDRVGLAEHLRRPLGDAPLGVAVGPTVKYEVALYGDKQEGLGELAVIFRTQSAQLLQSMTQFFRLWKQIEDAHLSGVEPDYALYDGKFVRTLSLPPDHDYTSEEIARAISDYVQLFDRLMKAYLAGKYPPPEIEALYCAEQQRAAILI